MIVIEERKICRMLEGLFQFDKECEWNDAIEEAMHRFVNLPTVDAVEVVRCKDCKHRIYTDDGESNPDDIVCDLWETDGLTEADYCSRGERRTDED